MKQTWKVSKKYLYKNVINMSNSYNFPIKKILLNKQEYLLNISTI